MGFAMSGSLAGATVLLVGLATLGFVLSLLDKLLDSRDREIIRSRAESFWFRTASLELHEQFQLALRSRYAQVRRLQPYFVGAFLIVAVSLAIFGAIWGALATPKEIKEFQQKLIKADMGMRYGYYFTIDAPPDEPEFGDADGSCTIGPGFSDMLTVRGLGEVKASLTKFLDDNEHNAFAMRSFSSIIHALIPLILAIPLTIGLLVSFSLTLWLLSRFTESRTGAFLIVTVDLIVALVMPTIVSGVLLSIGVFVVVFSVDGMPDYASIGKITWMTLAIASVCFLLGTSLSTPFVVAAFAKEFTFGFVGPTYIISTLAQYAYGNAKSFFVDLGRVVTLDFKIEPLETLINYAIGLDLLFSLIYIVPCLTLVLMQRSTLTRTLFLNIIQWVAEHPKGPLIALEEIVTAFGKYLVGVVKR
jgi:hypothetical protein